MTSYSGPRSNLSRPESRAQRLPIPLLGTPLFFEYLNKDEILPRTRIRDLDGTTLSLRPWESLESFADFWPRALRWQDRKTRMVARTFRFARRYRKMLGTLSQFVNLGNTATQLLPRYRNRKRTFISTTDCLDPVYNPAFRVDSRFASYFQPTYLTDAAGHLNPQLSELLTMTRCTSRTAVGA